MSTATYDPARAAHRPQEGAPTAAPLGHRRDVTARTRPVDLEPTIFGIEPNLPCPQVVTASCAARSGHPSTKTVRSAGWRAKPFRRRAPAGRAGSSRSHLGGRWRRLAEAPQLRPETPRRCAPRPVLGPVGPRAEERGAASTPTGGDAADKSASPPSPPRHRGLGVGSALRRRRSALRSFANLATSDHHVRRAERPTCCATTGCCSPTRRCPALRGHRDSHRDRRRGDRESMSRSSTRSATRSPAST